MARSTADLSLAFGVLAGAVVERPTGSNPPVPYQPLADDEAAGLRVGILRQVGDWVPAPAVRRAVDVAAARLEAAGIEVEEWSDAPNTQQGVELFFRIVAGDRFAFVRQILGGEAAVPLMRPTVRLTSMPGPVAFAAVRVMRLTGQERLATMLASGGACSGAELMDILGDRLAYESRFLTGMERHGFDAVLCPAVPVPAVRHGATGDLADFWGSALLFNVLGMPAGVAPVTNVRSGEESDRPTGRDKAIQAAAASETGSAGLPVGVQVAAPHWREEVVLGVMAVLEKQLRDQGDHPGMPPL